MNSNTTTDPVMRIGRVLNGVAAVLLLLISIATTVAVVSRSLGGRSYAWTLEASEYGMVIMTFLPIMLLVRQNEQIQVTIINDENAPRLTRVLDVVNGWIELAVAIVFFLASSYVTYASYVDKKLLTGVLHMPRWYLTGVMALSSLAWIAAHLWMMVYGRKSAESIG